MEPFEITPDISRRDTICAISTPPGVGGIAVARVCGPKAIDIVDSIWHGCSLAEQRTHTVHFGTISGNDGKPLDQCVATVFRSPQSFTGDDTVELSVHGSRYVQRELLNTLISAGARLAQPGEFTRRSFASGKMDLAEAEAVADVIASSSRASHRIAMNQMRGGYSRRLAGLRQKLLELASLLELELDFSEEEVEFASREQLRDLATEISGEINRLHNSFAAGTAIKDGIPVAIAGQTNAGKSSLLNALLGDDRAIVSDIHGTTRDTIEDTAEIGDYLFRFIDTAGIRDTDDPIEQLGISRSFEAVAKARIVILVCDPAQPVDWALARAATRPLFDPLSKGYFILAINKADMERDSSAQERVESLSRLVDFKAPHAHIITLSAKTGENIDRLRELLQQIGDTDAGLSAEDSGILVTNARHAELLSSAALSSERIISGLNERLPGDLIAQDVRETIHHLGAITGAITTPDILATIFSRFCVGK